MIAQTERKLDADIGATSAQGQYVRCNLCGSGEYKVVLRSNTTEADLQASAYACTSPHVSQHGQVVRCTECSLVYTNPRPSSKLVEALYSQVEDEVYLQEEEARVATFRHSLAGIRKHTRSGKLLDVGCHVGTFLGVAQRAGFEVEGVEPSEWAAEVARGRGLRVHTGSLVEAGLERESFDVVSAWDVIEHVTDPVGELERMRELLVPGGLLVLSTMDVGSPLPRLLGGRWPWYMLMHLYYFTPQTLTVMLHRAGYEVIKSEPHVRVLHLRYVIGKLEAYSSSGARLVGRLVERLGLGGMRLPIYLGDLFTIYARKR